MVANDHWRLLSYCEMTMNTTCIALCESLNFDPLIMATHAGQLIITLLSVLAGHFNRLIYKGLWNCSTNTFGYLTVILYIFSFFGLLKYGLKLPLISPELYIELYFNQTNKYSVSKQESQQYWLKYFLKLLHLLDTLNPKSHPHCALQWPLLGCSARKGYLFQGPGIWKGKDFTSWSIWKGREICHFGL